MNVNKTKKFAPKSIVYEGIGHTDNEEAVRDDRIACWLAALNFVANFSIEGAKYLPGIIEKLSASYNNAALDRAELDNLTEITTAGPHGKRLRFWKFVSMALVSHTPRDLVSVGVFPSSDRQAA